MTDLPTGTVTLLFTDIEGSTRLLQALGPAYGEVLGRHRSLLRDAIDAHGGVLFGTEGDACFVAFPSADAALDAAAQAQAALAAADWPGSRGLRVRMGVHTGTPAVVDGDYVGLDVHRAARISSAAHGGQVLVSAASIAAARGVEAAGMRDLGHHRLKDLDRPEHLYQLLGPGLDQDFPPPRSLPPASNLPSPPTSFVGRERELADLRAMLTDPAVRLLTLTGPGGTGKTRLAIEVGRSLVERFPDGVWFVPLAAVAEPDRVGLAVVDTFGLDNPQGVASAELVVEYLRGRTALLVLDNFEHVAAAADWVSKVLLGAPRTKLLVTSRVLLALTGEHEYPLRPLELPDAGAVSPERLMDCDAVALFVQRATAVHPRFALDQSTAADVADVCGRLDGLPLAIELAAARLRMLTVADVRRRLQRRLPVLESRARDLPERQRTLRSTIDWSYRLLSPEDQAVFRRLSVFVGGCTLEAAEAVIGADGDRDRVSDALETLVEHSLVWRDESQDTTRYRMLATISEFAVEQLEKAGELDELRGSHADWFNERAKEANQRLEEADQRAALAWFDTEMDNLLAALAWTLERPGDDGHETALELARSVGYVWYTRGVTREALAWLGRILEVTGGSEALWARVLYWYAAFGDRQGRSEPAVENLREATALLTGEGDTLRLAQALNAFGDAAYRHGDHDDARRRWLETLALVGEGTSAGDDGGRTVASAVMGLGLLAFDDGDHDKALELLERALDAFRRLDDRRAVAACRRHLARVLAERGDRAAADELLAASLAAVRAEGAPVDRAETLEAVAALAARSGEAERAGRLIVAAAAVRAEAGAPLPPGERMRLARDLAPASASIGHDVLAAAASEVADGQAIPADQAVGEALAWIGRPAHEGGA